MVKSALEPFETMLIFLQDSVWFVKVDTHTPPKKGDILQTRNFRHMGDDRWEIYDVHTSYNHPLVKVTPTGEDVRSDEPIYEAKIAHGPETALTLTRR